MIVDRKTADALYRVNFGAFAYAAYEVVHPHEPLCPNWHIDCICHHLAAMEAGRLPARLIANLPPRSLKSYLVSVAGSPGCWVASQVFGLYVPAIRRSLRINSPAIVGL